MQFQDLIFMASQLIVESTIYDFMIDINVSIPDFYEFRTCTFHKTATF